MKKTWKYAKLCVGARGKVLHDSRICIARAGAATLTTPWPIVLLIARISAFNSSSTSPNALLFFLLVRSLDTDIKCWHAVNFLYIQAPLFTTQPRQSTKKKKKKKKNMMMMMMRMKNCICIHVKKTRRDRTAMTEASDGSTQHTRASIYLQYLQNK